MFDDFGICVWGWYVWGGMHVTFSLLMNSICATNAQHWIIWLSPCLMIVSLAALINSPIGSLILGCILGYMLQCSGWLQVVLKDHFWKWGRSGQPIWCQRSNPVDQVQDKCPIPCTSIGFYKNADLHFFQPGMKESDGMNGKLLYYLCDAVPKPPGRQNLIEQLFQGVSWRQKLWRHQSRDEKDSTKRALSPISSGYFQPWLWAVPPPS